ncbi:MAG TPA: 1,4-alpha-glucan branching protein GlgB [Pirellulales bacterium]|jgi:1,4-alpha-glucan branching enzyme|nr:1,4-alpha-glucan branching protein GlgB [Pirellulales bacterium]
MRTTAQLETIGRLIEGRSENPFEVLGPHEIVEGQRRAMAVRAFLPDSAQAWIVDETHSAVPRPMRRIHPAGLYEAICPLPESGQPQQRYLLQVADSSGNRATMHDPYSFPQLLSDYDLHLLNEGTHWRSYEKLGAQLRTIDGVDGVNFAVWAPNATSVSVIGDFNGWDGRRHPLRKHIPSGFWELFVPGLGDGTLYKYQVRHHGEVYEKSDPYGFAAELPPRTASKVCQLDRYHWHDGEWMNRRVQTNGLDAPMSVYEVHLGSWRRPDDDPSRWLTYRELAHELVDYVREMGFTHIELLPITEHPFSGSWGYQTVGYYAPTSRFGSPADFMYFVDHCHQNGIGVMLDWVPAHFPRDAHGLRLFDGTALYEHADPRKGEHRDWGTLIFNYGRHEVRNFLLSNALFWLDKYHLDGLRVDAVASMVYLDYSRNEGEWIPNEFGGRENLEAVSFLKELNIQTHLQYPGVLTVAEESTAWTGVSRPTYLGGLGFSLKWNMGWMNDTLRYMHHEPIHRRYHHDELTFSLIYAFTENFCLPLSHDEVVHGKGSLLDQMPGDLWQRFANLRLLYAYMWAHPGKKLLFMGGELGQWNEWNYDTSLQWDLLQWDLHRGLKKFVSDLNHLYRREPALHQVDFDHHGFEWIDCHNYDESIMCFMRKAKDPRDFLAVCCNFTPVPREHHRVGLPERCWYNEIANSDSIYYGGGNVGNGAGVMAENIPWHGRPFSAAIAIPPLGVTILKPQR